MAEQGRQWGTLHMETGLGSSEQVSLRGTPTPSGSRSSQGNPVLRDCTPVCWTVVSLQREGPGKCLTVPGSPEGRRPWEPAHTDGPRALLGRGSHSLPPPAAAPNSPGYVPLGDAFSPRKTRARAWQTPSNAALGLPVPPRWLQLLLASARALNFSPLSNHSQLPAAVLLTGARGA